MTQKCRDCRNLVTQDLRGQEYARCSRGYWDTPTGQEHWYLLKRVQQNRRPISHLGAECPEFWGKEEGLIPIQETKALIQAAYQTWLVLDACEQLDEGGKLALKASKVWLDRYHQEYGARCVACGASVKDEAQYQASRCPRAAQPDLDARHTLTLGAKDALGGCGGD